MRKFALPVAASVLSFMAGTFTGTLLPRAQPATQQAVQVPPGESWADAWDVANGTIIPNFGWDNGPPPKITYSHPATGLPCSAPVAASVWSGKEKSGYLLEDGRAVVLRYEKGLFVEAVLCDPD